MRKKIAMALALAAILFTSSCRLHPSSPGFLPDGSSLWFVDVDKDDGTTVRTRMYWCHGTVEQPQPCGTDRQWSWGEIGTVAP